jgi:hypothetical protein
MIKIKKKNDVNTELPVVATAWGLPLPSFKMKKY